MKKILITIILFIALIVSSNSIMAQGPPDPPEDPGSGGDPVGGAAPVGSGIGFLLVMGGAYGARKGYKIYKN